MKINILWSFLFVSFLTSSFQTKAYLKGRMVLRVDSKVTYSNTGAYGTAGVTIQGHGEAYIFKKNHGKFSGEGELDITYKIHSPPSPYYQYSLMKGRGKFKIAGLKEGRKMRFWSEPGQIPVKGTLTVNLPNGTTQVTPYEDTYDPQTLAPGGEEAERGFLIELKDQAKKTVDYGGLGQTNFILNGVQIWRVIVSGKEIDNFRPYISNPKLRNASKELPLAVLFSWKLGGEFVVLGKNSSRTYHHGNVFLSNVSSIIDFDHWDLYNCNSSPFCQDFQEPSILVGKEISGKVIGKTVQLKWPKYFSADCIICRPKKSYLGNIPYRQTFGTKEFIRVISNEKIPLIDSKTIEGGLADWMEYKIKIHKIK